MTVKKYLCPWIGDPATGFRVPIVDDLDYRSSSGSSCVVLDLRTHENYRDRDGQGLITLDCPDALHAILTARHSLVEVTGTTTKSAIDTIIGAEATDEQFRNPDEYLSRIEGRRAQRRRTERQRVR